VIRKGTPKAQKTGAVSAQAAEWLRRAGNRCRPTITLEDGTIVPGTCDWTPPRPLRENPTLFVLYYRWFLPRYLPSFTTYTGRVQFSLCERHRTSIFMHPPEAIALWLLNEIVAKLNLNPKIPVEREDLSQEAYLKMLERDWFRSGFAAFVERRFEAYIMRCVKNLHTDLGKSEIARRNRETGFLEMLQDIGQRAGPTDPLAVLRRFIAGLPLEDRFIFERHLQGFTPTSIARELKRGKTYVYDRLARLREALRAELA
jgi:DNA-directed RNA polymerase specialized sigma24 family protein